MRIATWNVNSIRARSELVVEWLTENDIDVLAMQETKCDNGEFPSMSFAVAGYDVAYVGSGGRNGVALASRTILEDIETSFPGQPRFPDDATGELEARAISARCGGIRVWSLYVPNGRAVDDPHYIYKLKWLTALRDISALWKVHDPAAQIMLAGDWNIAPTDNDVWDREYFEGKTHVTDPERNALREFTDTGFVDSAAPFAGDDYTFWDYTQLRFARKEGMRIDYAMCSPALDDRITNAWVDRDTRKLRGASDHAPVVFEIGIS
ncbi:exodeoxyribonuclease III [Gordonia sp. CPCC 205333]|uniref:exodeoxyribonuclease III n=1 Tax=Gordonia sp. CPCC 205333 TaxID=3140790 RepID=UPI003AF38F12